MLQLGGMNERDNKFFSSEINKSPERRDMLLSTVSAHYSEKAKKRAENEPNQDITGVDDLHRIYGVYDGVGGDRNGDAAAQVCANSIYRSLKDIQPRSQLELVSYLKNAHNQARYDVKKDGKGGSTVATTVKIVDIEGKTYAGIAQAGDTRLFLYSKKTDSYFPLTQDQSRGNIVFNSFPCPASAEAPDQFKVIQLDYGDRLMLCSDGITGDWEHQFLSNEEFLDAFRERTPKECVASFFRSSKKNDDKSCIVFDTVPANRVR